MKQQYRYSYFYTFLLMKILFFFPFGLKAQSTEGDKFASRVKQISFSCVPDETKKGKMLLQWSTSQEDSLNYFVLERSTDGNKFTDAAVIFTAGDGTGTTQYQFRDVKVKAPSGKVYYRFRLVDTAGAYGYSNVWTIPVTKR
jgi:hypothetical protein